MRTGNTPEARPINCLGWEVGYCTRKFLKFEIIENVSKNCNLYYFFSTNGMNGLFDECLMDKIKVSL